MADKGSSQWNGKYGDEEAQRRKNYDRGILKLKVTHNAGFPSMKQWVEGNWSKQISDEVPRRKP